MEKNYDKEIAHICGRLDNVERTQAVHEKKIDQINTADRENAVKMAIVGETLKRIEENTDQIKENVEQQGKKTEERFALLEKQRDQDHLEAPKKKVDKYIEHGLMLLLGAVVAYIISQAFPFLGS